VSRRTWHLITGEYPPQPGGVADYTAGVARGLAEAGDPVYVWCPAGDGPPPDVPGVSVRPDLGKFRLRDWFRLSRGLGRLPGPRRLLVQWVPHAFGWRSMNLPFCLWLWLRSVVHRDEVEVMVHEPFVQWAGSRAQRLAAVVHRLMTVILLRSASRVYVSTPAWVPLWKPYAFRKTPFIWLPVPATVPAVDDPAGVTSVRSRLEPGGLVLGHFGTYGRLVIELLEPALVRVLKATAGVSVVLMGRGGEGYREDMVKRYPEFAGRITATGRLEAADLSRYLQACDLLVQPYSDGVSGRRTSLLAALAHGRPVVTTTGRHTEKLWAESGAVALSPTGDAEGLATVTERLLADPEGRARLGARAAALYRDVFDVSHTIAALRQDVAAGSRPFVG
jgi:glycosyltransferase involved in cell wall biosynthesis